MEKFCEMLLPSLILLVPNSAKVMASSATTALKFIIQVGLVAAVSVFILQLCNLSPPGVSCVTVVPRVGLVPGVGGPV